MHFSCLYPTHSSLSYAEDDLCKAKIKTLPQTQHESEVGIDKSQLINQASNTSEESQSLKLKFNTSYQNLRCFMSSQKPERYRSVSTRLSKQSKSEVCLSNLRFDFKNPHFNLMDEARKSQTARQTEDEANKSKDGQESDLSQILSNEIIHEIQQKGIKYNWNNDKSQYIVNENLAQQCSQFEQVLNAFTDGQIKSKKSLQRNLTINSEIIIEQCLAEQAPQFSNENISIFKNEHLQANMGDFNSNYNNRNYSFNNSIQPYSNIYYPERYQINTENNQNTNGLRSMPAYQFDSNYFVITPYGLGRDPRTTLMIKNIPNKYTIQFLSDQIDQDFHDYYDFLYLPCDTKSGANQGYGFINFIDLDAITRFYERFHGKKWKRFRSEKICNLTYARLQGIDSLINHFQNSKVLNHKEKKFQPIIKSLPQIHNLIKKQQDEKK